MARFEGGGQETPDLNNTTLFDDFAGLRVARAEQDAHIEFFFESLDEGFLERSFRYTNNQGRTCVEAAPVAVAGSRHAQPDYRAASVTGLAPHREPLTALSKRRSRE